MFLNQLNNEERSIFLKLAIAVIKADGKLEEKEKLFVAEYSREMGVTDYDLNENIEPLGLAEKIGKDSTDAVKRIFLLELVALANADGEFAESEKTLILSLLQKFGLTENQLNDCIKLLAEYNDILAKLTTFIQEAK
ncbi:MAG: hypothetical protein PUF61_13170 [Spirochaetales bacterium]|nr:hypothetical protein [Spirochaetales bacterium]